MGLFARLLIAAVQIAVVFLTDGERGWSFKRRWRSYLVALLIAGVTGFFVWGDRQLVPDPPPGLHAEGRESPTEQGLDLAVNRFLNTRAAGLEAIAESQLGAAGAPVAAFGEVACLDLRQKLPTDGNPAGWELTPAIKRVAVHSTGTPDSSDVRALAIAQYHVNSLGWSHLGYHFVVARDGACEFALDPRYQGYHAFRWNRDSVAVALAGVKDYTPAQLDTYRKLVAALMERYGVPESLVQGHRDFSRLDREAVARGERLANVNDHVDPCPGSANCGWEVDKLGLKPFLAARAAPAPPPPAPLPSPPPTSVAVVPTLPVGEWTSRAGVEFPLYTEPSRRDGDAFQGNVTFYARKYEGGPLASGAGVYDPDDPYLAATFLVPDRTGDGRPDPAWPFHTWLRVTDPKTGVFRDVEVLDTGRFGPPALLDLSEEAFVRVGPCPDGRRTCDRTDPAVRLAILNVGRLDVRVTVMHTPPADGAKDPCRYVEMSGYPVCFEFAARYAGNWDRYGFPTGRLAYAADGTAYQTFQKGIMYWTAARGFWDEVAR